jgi:imidazolonepropionase-like amidohydrolase
MVSAITFGGMFARADEPPFAPPALAIKNATIRVSAEREAFVGNLVIRERAIQAVGPDVAIPADAKVIDGTGLFVYAAFFDGGNIVLLDKEAQAAVSEGRNLDVSRSALAATPVDQRKGLTPDFRSATAVSKEGDRIAEWRDHGFVFAHVIPEGRLANGRSCVVTTSGLPKRESVLRDAGLSSFGLIPLRGNGYPATRMGGMAHLRQALLDADAFRRREELYRRGIPGVSRPPEDPVLSQLSEDLTAGKPWVFRAETRDEIHRALDFAEEWKVSPILWGGRDANLCLDRIVAGRVPVLLTVNWGDAPKVEPESSTDPLVVEHKAPVRWQRDQLATWERHVAAAKVLESAGVRFAFSSEGCASPAEFLKRLRETLKAGLSEKAYLAALTSRPAELLADGSRIGTIEAGRGASLVVLDRTLVEEKARVKAIVVEGEWREPSKKTDDAGTGESTPAVDVSGEWRVVVEAGDRKQDAVLEFNQIDKRLGGSFKSSQGEGKLNDGSVKGRSVKFTVQIGAGLQTLSLEFEGTADEDRPRHLKGIVKSPFGAPVPWTAKRSSPPSEMPARKDEVQKGEPATPVPPKNPVSLALDTAAGETRGATKPPENPGEPQQAGEKVDTGKPAPETPKHDLDAAPGDWPIELESDRTRRPISTGGNVFIKNGTVLAVVGAAQPETHVLVKGGKIVAIGKDLIPDEGMTVIDATGRYVMPGIIDTHSHIMFQDALGGVNEATMSIVPEVRVRDVMRSDDPAAYRALAGGVTTIRLLHGSANVVGGQDCVVKLKYGQPVKNLLFPGAHQGVKFALGENVKFQDGRFPNTRLGVEATLQRAFFEAWEYRRQWREYREKVDKIGPEAGATLAPPRRDLRLEALADILDQKKFIHSHCYRADEILMLLRVANSFGIRVWSLQHVLEGYKVAPEIAAHRAACSIFADWWAYKIEAFDAIPHAGPMLLDAGVNVCLKSDDAELMRHLYQDAAKMLRYGDLSPETALRLITLNPAIQLGIDARVGSIEPGKDADLAIFSGHPLNAFSRCEATLIDGEVHFQRETVPSAMLAATATASGVSRPLSIAPDEARRKTFPRDALPTGPFALVKATLHPMDGPVIEEGTVVVRDGKIAALGKAVPLEDVTVVDGSGLHVWPGLIDAGCIVGLYEIGKARETHDYGETGPFQPDLRAAVAVNPDSELIPVTRAGGVTSCLVRPTGGLISGQASLVRLGGWTAPEMTLSMEAGLRLHWPTEKDNQKAIDQIGRFLEDAKTYLEIKDKAKTAGLNPPVADPRYDALAPYLKGERPVFVAAHGRREIAQAVLFAEKHKLKLVLTGASDAWKLAEELGKRKIPVIVGPVMRGMVTPGQQPPLPNTDPFDAYYANPGRLRAAGVELAFQSDDAANSRNVPFEAAMAVSYGLSEEDAMRALTLGAATILGWENRLGSITAGKDADLIVTDGSPLQPSTRIKGVVVGGKWHAPESRHTRLHEKYRERLPGHP